MEGGSGPRGGVHNKQMFILSGFIISDPDCISIYINEFIVEINFDIVVIYKLKYWVNGNRICQ